MEGATKAALSLFFCDEIESVVTGGELTQTGSDELGDLVAEVGAFLVRKKRKLKRRGSFKL